MTDNKPFADYLNSSPFIIKLLKAVLPVYARDMRRATAGGKPENKVGDNTLKETHLKEIMTSVGNLQSNFEDLEKVVKYLRLEKSKIALAYDGIIAVDDYYKYHYDNFVIRLLTSIDICGKIGVALFQLPIAERNANGYTFARNARIKGTEPAEKILVFSDFLEDFKTHRHNKIHQGISLNNRFEKIVFWENIGKLLEDPSINTPALEAYNQEQILEAVNGIEEVISDAAKLSFEFLDSLEGELDKVLAG